MPGVGPGWASTDALVAVTDVAQVFAARARRTTAAAIFARRARSAAFVRLTEAPATAEFRCFWATRRSVWAVAHVFTRFRSAWNWPSSFEICRTSCTLVGWTGAVFAAAPAGNETSRAAAASSATAAARRRALGIGRILRGRTRPPPVRRVTSPGRGSLSPAILPFTQLPRNWPQGEGTC